MPKSISNRLPMVTALAMLVVFGFTGFSAWAEVAQAAATPESAPSVLWALPFALLLLFIAVLPLTPHVSHWWDVIRNKLIVSVALAMIVTVYYATRGDGFLGGNPGLSAAGEMLHHAIIGDYIPFIILLFSLYAISGGIRFTGDIPAHPITNTVILAVGALLASFIGTTGASMLLIRPLLQINSERKHVQHTVIFFIFLVSNVGGVLLPVGDPPLFLGYLRGVPFLWTLHLLPVWAFASAVLLAVYYVIELRAHKHETRRDLVRDEEVRVPLKLEGKLNFVLLAGVVLSIAFLVPDQPFLGTGWILPNIYLREIVQLALVALSFQFTPKHIRKDNGFDFGPMNEVACLFIGIFITMQAPIEILRIKGPTLGLTSPMQFFWVSGMLSSFLDNAPTYTVFFEFAGTLQREGAATLHHVATSTGQIMVEHLMAISAGSVFMGANSYIGNGPNFLVKGIAERQGVKMPSFFGYMVWSGLILIPLFVVVTIIFFR